ncbi:probable 3-hydroxyisobutyryl-CoA hydrolase 2 [Spinacia oleracea]|uniref:3-hydroxyisobutyryl-CoA hydrolase n=1 Tax=Spinacia oleracea TaxID=3562 RepID=A0ABM3QJB8_SPIOL|nr:probable 3-hydroxyisobutyryl-CoA hydrolase 2 [Spinacia oleracea]
MGNLENHIILTSTANFIFNYKHIWISRFDFVIAILKIHSNPIATPSTDPSPLISLMREGRLQGVGQCLICEFRMVFHVLQGDVSKDFFEGCRAIFVDKDKNPKVTGLVESFAVGSD